jgi:hypothetical protein
MFFFNRTRGIKGSLLFGGLLCLGLTVLSPAHASPSIIPHEKVEELQKALKKADRTTIFNLLAVVAGGSYYRDPQHEFRSRRQFTEQGSAQTPGHGKG